MKKILSILLLVIICSGCFWTRTKTLKCSLSTNIDEVSINYYYVFTYKKDKIDNLSLKVELLGDNNASTKIYNKYVSEYERISNDHSSVIVNFDEKKKLIDLNFYITKDNYQVLNELNLSFVKNTSFNDLKKDLGNTEYKCK